MNENAKNLDDFIDPVQDVYLEPHWFGPRERPLFGWQYLSRQRCRQNCVVICPPFGHEAMVIHRAYRHLAMSLAQQGFATLRFDYDGTGDSAGDLDDPDRLNSWRQSIVHAMKSLKTASGADSVILFGMRFGALLAVEAALENQVNGLVIFAPVVSGRSYVRELQAFRALSSNSPKVDALGHEDLTRNTDHEVTGYPLTPAIIADITNIDLLKIDGPRIQKLPKNILLVTRDDMPGGESRLIDCLKKAGIFPLVKSCDGFSQVIPDDAYKAILPKETWDQITHWLVSNTNLNSWQTDPPDLEKINSQIVNHFCYESSSEIKFREYSTTFAGLFGVVCQPLVPVASRPMIILNNIGANHHVGPHRLWVKLSRHLAEQGFSVLRFDRSGLGDSSSRDLGKENDIYAQNGVEEVQKAIDFAINSSGHDKVVLVGLCSGAYFSYHTGVVDSRIASLILINPVTFEWREGDSLEIKSRQTVRSTGFYGRAIQDRKTWLRLFKGEIHLGTIGRALYGRLTVQIIKKLTNTLEFLRLKQPVYTAVAQGFLNMAERGVHLTVVYDADDGGLDMIQSHLGVRGQSLQKYKNFSFKIIEGADHTFTQRWSQNLLIAYIEQKLREQFL